MMNKNSCLRSLNPVAEKYDLRPSLPVEKLVLPVLAGCFFIIGFRLGLVVSLVSGVWLVWRNVLKEYFAQRRRVNEFRRDLPVLLVSLASVVGSGGEAVSALIECADLFDEGSEMRNQLEEFSDGLRRGLSEAEAISGFGASLDCSELALFRRGLLMSRKEGATLRPTLRRLARVIRQRQAFHRKIKSALALQRISALGLVVCATVVLCVQYTASPEAVLRAFSDEIGFAVMLTGFGLMSAGSAGMFFVGSRETRGGA